jgi:hypothetical protein
MKTTQRKTAAEMLKQYNSSKKEIVKTIKDIVKEKEITSIRLNFDSRIAIAQIDDDFLEITEINKKDVTIGIEVNDGLGIDYDRCKFEDLELHTLISILNIIEGDISEITDDEDEE